MVPARYRDKLGSEFFLTIAPGDRCLLLYTAASWQSVEAKLRDVPNKDEAHWDFVHKLTAPMLELEFDAQGRILLPASHRQRVGIERDVVLLGALSRLELWAKERVPDLTPSKRDIERAAQLGLD